MATFVHARRRDGQILFRVWNTCVDQYETDDLPRDQMHHYLLVERPANAREIIEKIREEYRASGKDPGPRRGYYVDSSDEVEERLVRAETNGTSSQMGDKDDLDGPWDTEMCHCGAFHHAFDLRSNDQLCWRCGEPEDDRGHRPACGPRTQDKS